MSLAAVSAARSRAVVCIGARDRDLACRLRSSSLPSVYRTDHPDTVTALSNLAYAYGLTGDRDRATEMHRVVLAARELIYGPDHPHTEVAPQLLVNAENQATGHERPNGPDNRQAEN